jgi:carbamoyltransferase
VIDSPNFVEVAAEALADGQVAAWFQGGAEFGPRALGHRSILADPRRPEMRSFINASIKQREDFRPFAPAVPAEDVSLYFDWAYDSPYMILVAPVRPEWAARIPSVVHQDGSARIQTVTAESDPGFHALLRAFGARTGVSVLLNTSFNKRRMPIVETPHEALTFFLACPLDLLVIDRFIVRKVATPRISTWDLVRFFAEELQDALDRKPVEACRIGGVYAVRIATARLWTIDLSGERPIIREGTTSRPPSLTINVTEDDFRAAIVDPIGEGRRLLDESKVHIDGDRMLLYNLARVFDLRRPTPGTMPASQMTTRPPDRLADVAS